MATKKLSQIAALAPTSVSDQIVGVIGGATDALYAISQIGAIPATANVNFYISPSGSDSNNGLSALTPFATLAHALTQVILYDYQLKFGWIINVANGTYTENTGTAWLVPPCRNCVSGTIKFSPGNTPSNIVFTHAGGFNHQGLYILLTSGSATFDMYIQNSQLFLATTGFLDNQVHNTITLGSGTFLVDATNVPFHLATFSNLANGSIQDQGSWTLQFAGSAFNSIANISAGCVSNIDFPIVFPASAFTLANALQISQGSPLVIWTPTVTNGGFVTGGGVVGLFVGTNADIVTSNAVITDIITGAQGQLFDPTIMISGTIGGGLGLLGVRNSGAPDTSLIAIESWMPVKDTTNGPITIAYNNDGVVLTRQFGNFINTQTGASYTLALFDAEGIVEMNNAGANTLTVPANATVAFAVGTKISVVQIGAGATTIAAAGGVTVHNAGALTGQYASALLYKRATNEWTQLNGAF